jgi:hypothetical protein
MIDGAPIAWQVRRKCEDAADAAEMCGTPAVAYGRSQVIFAL